MLEQAAQRLEFDLESRRLRERLRNERGMGNLIGPVAGDGEGVSHLVEGRRSRPILC